MSRPDPIQYAERLYTAIRTANFSPISFLAFGNAVKDGVDLRRMPRIAAEPFMRVVGEMLDLEEETAGEDIIDAEAIERAAEPYIAPTQPASIAQPPATPMAANGTALSAAERATQRDRET
jgi:hypothetical protein